MSEEKLSSHLEALLFLAGEPITVSRLAKILGKKESEVKIAAIELSDSLKERGIRLLNNKGELTLGTAPESSKYCEALVKEELNKSISRAGLETLAIVLYKGAFSEHGVSRADIDYIRGVNSSFTLRNLSIRGLVLRKTNPKDKRGFVYAPSMQLLQYLGLGKKEDLPNFEDFVKQMENALSNPQNN